MSCIVGLQSIYMWEGKGNADAEILLMIKTRSSLIPKLTEWVKANHPYDECEVIAVPIHAEPVLFELDPEQHPG